MWGDERHPERNNKPQEGKGELTGFIPDPGMIFSPSEAYQQILETINNDAAREFWSSKALAKQRTVLVAAASAAVGINMTFMLPYSMRARGWGRIVNITSYSVKQPMHNMVLSNSLRLGVVGWAKTLANEVAADGILVNNVCPGWTATERVGEIREHETGRIRRAVQEDAQQHAPHQDADEVPGQQRVDRAVDQLAQQSAEHFPDALRRAGAAQPCESGCSSNSAVTIPTRVSKQTVLAISIKP